MSVHAARWVVVASAVTIMACGGDGKAGTGAVKYSVSAQQNYEKGRKELKEKDWIAAAKYFSFIKARFPYSKYAVLSELRMADAEFGAGHYLQAIDSYKLFIKFHPTHEMVANGYATFRIGESYVKMLPSDFWLLPPSYEKDQSATADAERELKLFVKKYPKSPYMAKAREMLKKVSFRLAKHEWYVANFYWERNKPRGTQIRLRRLLDRYSGVGYDGDALWLLGKAYLRTGLRDRARIEWQKLVDNHPDHDRAGDARQELAKLSR
ncbi:MAG: outer membrane protein assembly factor BamD [Proteobacteria bacterium]|nr:outer membrane protein assembly factor BamD [Pseudomonadota bacterium]